MEVRRLRREEVSEVKRLCESAHWPYTLKDIERLYHLEPNGWFCAIVNGQYAGQAMGLRIESLGCIGIVIVHHLDLFQPQPSLHFAGQFNQLSRLLPAEPYSPQVVC